MAFGRPAGNFGFNYSPQVLALQNKRRATTQASNARTGSNYLSGLQRDFARRESGALAANKAREAEIRGTYDQLISRGQGAFRAARESDINQWETQELGSSMQQLVNQGLWGSTTAASITSGIKTKAKTTRLQLEDMIQQRQTELKLGKAGFVERIEQPYPDYNMLLMATAAQGSR